MSGDLLHDIWLGTESTSAAFFSGRIKTKGSLLKLMKLSISFENVRRSIRLLRPSISSPSRWLERRTDRHVD